MLHTNHRHNSHLAEINHVLSMYQALSFSQLCRLYPDLTQDTMRVLVKRLAKQDRIRYTQENGMVLYLKDTAPNPGTIAAFWVLLDFLPEITYHSVSDFPVSLTFFTTADSYDVIYAPREKEHLINHALSSVHDDTAHRLVIVEDVRQMGRLDFPGIAAFCTVTEDGKIKYFKKQGVKNHDG